MKDAILSLTEERVHIKFNQFLTINSETLICHLIWKHVTTSCLRNWAVYLYIHNKFSNPVFTPIASGGLLSFIHRISSLLLRNTGIYQNLNQCLLRNLR